MLEFFRETLKEKVLFNIKLFCVTYLKMSNTLIVDIGAMWEKFTSFCILGETIYKVLYLFNLSEVKPTFLNLRN